MKYISTRGEIKPVGFNQAVMTGLAKDGGLLVPGYIPQIYADTLGKYADLNYQYIAFDIMRRFVGDDIPPSDLHDLIDQSYLGFSHPDITPLVKVGEHQVLELFHGPTASFKDVALQFLGNLFEYNLRRDGGFLNIVGATSGDTGSAAIHGLRGKKRINVFMLHPKGRVTPVQERQMTTVLDPNIHNIAVEGADFDGCQNIVKRLFNDDVFKAQFRLGAVNSINWARIMAQIVYYAYAWSRASGGDPQKRVSFAVPTGNFGDVFAGYMARRMGLPIDELIIATNANNTIPHFVETGLFDPSETIITLSPAMDVQLASNLERYLYYLFGKNPAKLRRFFNCLARDGYVQISDDEHAQLMRDFQAVAVSDKQILLRILRWYDDFNYIMDPHTSTAVQASAGKSGMICLATAHSAKFDSAVRQSIGIVAEPPVCLLGLKDKETRCVTLPANTQATAKYISDHAITA
jgi:threonine synthase